MKRLFPLLNSLLILLALGRSAFAQGPSGKANQPAPRLAPAQGSTALAVLPAKPELFLGEARVSSRVDKMVITVGEIINYQMEVELPKGYDAAIPPPGAQLGEFLIRNYEIPAPEKTTDRVKQKFLFKITAYATGESSIPPVPVIVLKDKNPAALILAEEIRIRVAPVTSAEDMEIKDIKPPLPAPFNYRPLLLFGMVIAGLVIIGLAVLLIVSRLRRPSAEMPEPLPEPEFLALKEFADLDALGLLEKGQIEPYYTRLNEIFRRYLGLRFGIYALEFTTTEIMAALKNQFLEHATFQAVQNFLEECDLVKFAQFIPESKAQREMTARAQKIIELTRPAPAEEPEPARAAAGAS